MYRPDYPRYQCIVIRKGPDQFRTFVQSVPIFSLLPNLGLIQRYIDKNYLSKHYSTDHGIAFSITRASDPAMSIQDGEDAGSGVVFSGQRVCSYRHGEILCSEGYQ